MTTLRRPTSMKQKAVQNTLVNINNYGMLADIATRENMELYTKDITNSTWQNLYNSLLNILKDGIYDDYVQRYQVCVVFDNGERVDLSIMDLYMNIIMWRLLVVTDTPIRPIHIFYEDEMTGNSIKKYIDKFFISVNRTTKNNKTLSNIIADTLHFFHDIDLFSMYLSNTLNIEDTLDLMDADPEFNECMNADLSNIALDRVKEVGMEFANRSIDRIKKSKKILGYDHCLADAWRAREGINPKQYMEVAIGVGTKPDGKGGVFNHVITNSFMNGGVTDPVDYFIESYVSRLSQIIKFKSVSQSGAFARIMGLNNMDSFLCESESYDCNTKHLIPIIVKNDTHLRHLNLRYFRDFRNGIERCIDYETDKHLIGNTILLRDPITCASAARGHGVCYKCYGRLAYSVFDSQLKMGINIGRIASEFITSELTQKQLSVKHILDANIDKIIWPAVFYDLFELDVNIIQLSPQLENLKNYKMLIDPDDIIIENEADDSGVEDDSEAYVLCLSEYITSFDIVNVSTGEIITIASDNEEKLYFTNEFNGLIRKKGEPLEGKISISFAEIKDFPIFIIQPQNNEVTKILEKLKHLYNKASDVKNKTISGLLQEILDTNVEGNMNVSAIHYSVILMNQIRSTEDILDTPDWNSDNPHYQILTLNEALNSNPSVLISLSYQKIAKLMYTPLTYRKHKASFIDLFFMEKPQRLLRDLPDDNVGVNDIVAGEIYEPIVLLDPPDAITSSAADIADGYEDEDE